MERIEGGVCAVGGVRAYGVKEGKNGLAVVAGDLEENAGAAGVFTTNRVRAAPVKLTQARVERHGRLAAVVANSGCANAFTGEEGLRNAELMAELVARRLGVPEEEVGVASTGVIGKQLDMRLIERQINEVSGKLTSDAEGSAAAARAIMTTDTFPKEAAARIYDGESELRVGGIAKGAGMIFPHLATMLAFIWTDARLDKHELKACLKNAADRSFNMIVVDGDMSTNDMVLLVATGVREASVEAFQQGLNYVCETLAKMIARDGEGATKFVEVHVRGAASYDDARAAARAVARSPLVKSSIHGGSPNFGRIVAAVGAAGVELDESRIGITFEDISGALGSVPLVVNGRLAASLGDARRVMQTKELRIVVDLGVGTHEATAWGCDLSPEYVRLNL
ncbi:MAG: bifunctional ornithine acetyltransferase/N-acetylglutamate synthase [Candidatus Alkanophagales archaeon]